MRKNFILQTRLLLSICLFFFGLTVVYAQTELSGTIEDAKTKEPLVGVSISVKGKVIGTISDINGSFKLSTNTPPPFTLIISSVGYRAQEIEIERSRSNIKIALEDQSVLGQEIVVAASRVAESEMKSPVTVEKIDLRTIRETTASNFYDAMGNMKGINLTTQGLLFKSVNMRGFGTTGNPRVVQMIDGMDNQAPGLNFSVDNIVGMPELDVESVEVLPGAASALYGPNAINGLILMNSKSPFLYQGLSANVKTGIMHEGGRTKPTTGLYDFSMRYAQAFNDKFAYKVNLSYLTATDWEARSFANLNLDGLQDGTRNPGVNYDYDGVNIYGDEAQFNMKTVANSLALQNPNFAPLLGYVPDNVNISRTGLREQQLLSNNKTESFKANMALHYRLNERMELIGQVNYGYGTTLYTGTGRYALRDFNITQAKLELKGDNFNLRAYTTQERSGNSSQLGLTALQTLNEIKPHTTWFGEYVATYAGGRYAGLDEAAAHAAARAKADDAMPSDAQIRQIADKYNKTPIVNGGGGFLDKSNLYHLEGFFDFKNQIKFMDLMVGGNFREYELKSNGTLFADMVQGRNGRIGITEVGGFVQAGKALLNNKLKLLGSFRVDKNENFDVQYSPRLSGTYSINQNHTFRVSYQTGFRIPTTQNQYINLKTPGGTLIGGLSEFDDLYKELEKGITAATINEFTKEGMNYFTPEQQAAIGAKTETYVFTNLVPPIQAAVTAKVQEGVQAGVIAPEDAEALIKAGIDAEMAKPERQAQVKSIGTAFALEALPKYKAKKLKPERIASYEVGYKGLIAQRLFIDASLYWSRYRDFIGNTNIVVPKVAAGPGLPEESGVASATTREGFGRTANSDKDINVFGWAANLNYSFNKGYNAGVNITYNKLNNFEPSPEVLYASFNTPAYTYNFSFGKRLGSGDKYGFNVNLRHQDSFVWESAFLVPTTTGIAPFQNTIVPAITNVDAQVSMKVPSIKSIVKVGGTNIGGKSYVQAFGSSMVGSTYYVSLTFDQLFNR